MYLQHVVFCIADDEDGDIGLGVRVRVGVAWWTLRYPIEPDADVDLTVMGGGRYYF